jgi:spore germination protein Q
MMNNPYRIGNFGYPGYPQMSNASQGMPVSPVKPAAPVTPVPQAVQGAMQMPPTFPPPGQAPAPQGVNVPGQLPIEESFIENILRLNLGKIATIYMTFENNSEWNAKVFKGRLEAAGRDHIIISDPQTGMRYLLLMVNLDYVTFDEELNYGLPFGSR